MFVYGCGKASKLAISFSAVTPTWLVNWLIDVQTEDEHLVSDDAPEENKL